MAATEFATADVDAARAHMARVFRSHHLQPMAGERGLAMHHRAVGLGDISAHWLGYGARVVMDAPAMAGFHLFQVNLSGACEVSQGPASETVVAGAGYAVDPDLPLRKSWQPDSRQFIVRVERERLERHVRMELGVDLRRPLRFERLAPLAGRRLAVLMAALADDQSVGLLHPGARKPAAELLLASLLGTFRHSHSAEYDAGAAPAAPYYVRRAEEFIRAAAREPVTLEDMVRVSGVSGRSLFAGFRRFRGVSPMEYLKSVRLDLARADLLAADPATSSVTHIALACGFSHMSKFARDYKARFAASPSADLRRMH